MKKSSGAVKGLEWILITVGCVFFAVGVALFLNPLSLAPGGASGVAILINGLTGFPTGTIILLINIPLLIAGFFAIGREFVLKSVYATVLSSLMIDGAAVLCAKFLPILDDRLLGAVVGGVLLAVGMGIVFRCGGSTGGTDIVAKLLRKKFRSVPTGKIFLAVDSTIIAASAVATRDPETALYAAISLFISTRLLDVILYGTDEAKLLIVVSSCPEKIAERLTKEIDVGVTFLEGAGAYTGNKKRLILCAVKKHQFHLVKDLINEMDQSSFVIVSSASEIFGEGYKAHDAEEL